MSSAIPLDLINGEGVWLVEIEASGTYLFATETVDVLDEAGVSHTFYEGLHDQQLPIGRSGEESSITVTIDADEPWTKIVAEGAPIERGRAKFYRWFEGMVLEQARVHLEGVIEDVDIASPAAPGRLVFTLVDRPVRDAQLVPASTDVVSGDTWPQRTVPVFTTFEGVLGAYYNLIIGAPGGVEESATPVPQIPVYFVEHRSADGTSRWNIAGDRIHATSAHLFNLSNSTNAIRTIATAQDKQGKLTSYVDAAGFPAVFGAIDNEYYIGLRDDATYGGGMLNRARDGMAHGWAEVVQILLEEYTGIRIDAGNFALHADFLDAYLIDTFLNGQVNMWDWIRRELLPMVPARIVEGPRGLYFHVVRWDATVDDAVAYLDVSAGTIKRRSSIRTRPGSVANQFTATYQPIRQTGRMRKTRVLSGKPGVLDGGFQLTRDPRIWGSYRCALSQAWLKDEARGDNGIRPASIRMPHTWHGPTVGRHLEDLALERSLPRSGILYEGNESLESIGQWAVVVINDPAAHIIDRPAIVEGVAAGGGDTLLDVTLIPDQLVFSRATA